MGKKRTPAENAAILDAVYEQAGLDAAEKAAVRERTPEESEVLERVEARERTLIEEQRKLGFEEIRAITQPEEPASIPARILRITGGQRRAGRRLPGARLILLLCGALLAASAIAGRDAEFEYDLRNIRSRVSATRDFNRKMRTVFERARDPAVILTGDAAAAHAVAAHIERKRKNAGDASPVHSVLSSQALLPRDVERKLKIIARLRSEVEDIGETTDEPESERLASLREKLLVSAVRSADDLPADVLRPFRGPIGGEELVYVFQRDSLMDLRKAVQFERSLGQVTVNDKTYLPVSEPLLYADLLALLRRDAPVALGLCLLALLGVLFADMRSTAGVVLVLLPLAAGTVLMLGAMALSGTKLNILNAAVLPSLLGMGVDGGVHIYTAARRRGVAQMSAVLRESGSAVAVCTGTSMIGFGGMLIAAHPGLRSIAVLALIGLGSCLVGAIVVLPCLLTAMDSRVANRRRGAESSSVRPGHAEVRGER